jgi:pectate lyase
MSRLFWSRNIEEPRRGPQACVLSEASTACARSAQASGVLLSVEGSSNATALGVTAGETVLGGGLEVDGGEPNRRPAQLTIAIETLSLN